MSDKFAADFLDDQLAALLASRAFAVAEPKSNHGPASRPTVPAPEKEEEEEGDTEPAIDVQSLREALRAGVK